MNSFLRTVLLFVLVFSGLAFLVTSLLYSRFPDRFDYLESALFVQKFEHVYDAEDYQTIFVGSSLTYRQIDPILFDSLVGDVASPSFNLGEAGMFPTRSLKVAERLILNPPHPLKYLFLELNRLDYVQDNFSSPEIMFALDHADFYFCFLTILESGLRIDKKLYYSAQYARAYLYKYLGFGYYDLLTRKPSKARLKKSDDFWGHQPSGFLSKDVQLSLGLGAKSMTEDRARFLADTAVVGKNLKMIQKKYRNPTGAYSLTYLNKLKTIISEAESKGIEVILVLPPRGSAVTYDMCLPIFQHLPYSHRIDLADPVAFPRLYTYEYSFDKIHLNSSGAKAYTEYLSLRFNSITSKASSQACIHTSLVTARQGIK